MGTDNLFDRLMRIVSKFRTLYLVREVFFLIIFLLIDLLLSLLIYSLITDESILGAYFFIIVLIFFIYNQYSRLISINRISVTDEGISKVYLFSKKEEFFYFTKVLGMRTERVSGFSSEAGEISDGYFESVIEYGKNCELIISPDEFENYIELILAIRNQLDNH